MNDVISQQAIKASLNDNSRRLGEINKEITTLEQQGSAISDGDFFKLVNLREEQAELEAFVHILRQMTRPEPREKEVASVGSAERNFE